MRLADACPVVLTDTCMGYYSSFVVKIWVGDDQRMLRGYIQHVGTQDGLHFLSVDRMLSFMTGHLNPPPEQWHGQEEEVRVRTGTVDVESSED